MAGETDHASVVAHMLDAAGNLLLLRPLPFRRKDFVELRVGFRAQGIHEAAEVAVPGAALGAIGQVLGGWRFERFAAMLGEIALEQTVFLEVTRAKDHGCPPSKPRSLRAARNKCTRTVDSLRPMMAPTSRGVQSP